uniref:B-cell receptor CD22 n=1 Tax=Myripristis murdjan TaxID=586833 RepID=A0A668A1S0_9TELE
MKASTCRWLVFLAITIGILFVLLHFKNCLCNWLNGTSLTDCSTSVFTTTDFSCSSKLFETFDTHLRAKEGSCIEIRCTGDATQMRANEGNAVWYWIKNAEYHETNKNFTGTVIYSTTPKYPVSQEFEGRVEYLGSQSFGRQSQNKCGIRINNLQKTDSGNYSFRYEGAQIWMTNPRVNLTVEVLKIYGFKIQCLESGPVTLKCSTSSSCRFRPQIKELQLSYQQDYDENLKYANAFLSASLNQFLFSSVASDSPRNTEARKSPEDVKEGDIVTLTCSTRGRPDPAFSWFKDGTEATVKINVTGAEWKINSITASESGTYYCVATNKYGTDRSATIHIDVKFSGVKVDLETNSSEITEGEDIALTCAVSRSNPEPHSFGWYQNNNWIGEGKTYEIKQIQPERRGSYTCEATNSVGAARSQPHQINVSRYYVVDDSVKIREPLSLTCNTEAFPEPQTYSWYHNSHHKLSHSQKDLRIDRVDREDHGCYICSATNIIGPGTNSSATCIKVLFQPTNLTLWMPSEATEGQNITISCTTESFPLAQLTLSHINSNGQFSSTTSPPDSNFVSTIKVPFEVTPDDAGRYLCKAKNSEGSDSTEKELVVKYGPNVREKEDLVLKCKAESNPPVTSYTWRTTAARTEELEGQKDILTLRSVTPSHSGLYSCTAHNDLGTGKSQEFEVKVMYVKIDISLLNWKSPANLSCRCHSFPAVSQYQWYKITEEESDGTWVSSGQNYTVSPDKPGMYYCTAKNQMGLQPPALPASSRQHVRHQAHTVPDRDKAHTVGHGAGWAGVYAGVKRFIEEPSDTNGIVCGCHSQFLFSLFLLRPASNISTVYCTVNLPKGKQGKHDVYENIGKARAQKQPVASNFDSDSSEEDVEINYSVVNFKAKSGNQGGHHSRTKGYSSSDEEDKTQYSEVRI